MSTKNTPGPWHVGGIGSARAPADRYSEDLRVWGPDAACVAMIATRKPLGQKIVSAEMTGNARLVAAAPDLMAALIDAENMLDQLRDERVLDNELWDAIDKTVDKARAALAKADVG